MTASATSPLPEHVLGRTYDGRNLCGHRGMVEGSGSFKSFSTAVVSDGNRTQTMGVLAMHERAADVDLGREVVMMRNVSRILDQAGCGSMQVYGTAVLSTSPWPEPSVISAGQFVRIGMRELDMRSPDRLLDSAGRVARANRSNHPLFASEPPQSRGLRHATLVEPVAGRNLREMSENVIMSLPTAARISRAIIKSCTALAQHGLVNVDLKPGNIMVRSATARSVAADDQPVIAERDIVLIDTGDVQHAKAPIVVAGTHGYIAPWVGADVLAGHSYRMHGLTHQEWSDRTMASSAASVFFALASGQSPTPGCVDSDRDGAQLARLAMTGDRSHDLDFAERLGVPGEVVNTLKAAWTNAVGRAPTLRTLDRQLGHIAGA